MKREEQLAFCRTCHNRQMSKQGLICKLTDTKADFSSSCEYFDLDKQEQTRRHERDLAVDESIKENHFLSPQNRPARLGIISGIALMVISSLWFWATYKTGMFFYLQPVLFFIGLLLLTKGVFHRNIPNKRNIK